jgi:hypothetical protein
MQQRIPTEFEEQCLLFEWAQLSQGKYPELELLNASSNGVRLPIGAAMKLKRQGLKKGFPDINLPIPSKGFHGLYIELKRVKGSLTYPEQTWWIEKLTERGYRAVFCKGFEEARKEIEDYLSTEEV